MVVVVNDIVGIMMGCELGVGSCEVGFIVGELWIICDGGWGVWLFGG